MKNETTSKINSSTILLGFVAIVVGLVGTYTVRIALASAPAVQQEPQAAEKPPTRMTVPLASRDIPVGTEITLDDIALYRMTSQEIKETIDAKTFMTNPSQIIGKIVLASLKRGQTFDTKDLLPAGKVPGVSGRLKPGLRAVTVTMTPENALLGFAGAGQRVDVLFHYGEGTVDGTSTSDASAATGADTAGFRPGHHDFNPPRRRDYHGNTLGGSGDFLGSGAFQNATSTLIQDSEILALDDQSTPSDLASPLGDKEMVRVTLAVSPRQAEVLRVASGHGKLSLTLRSPDDGGRVVLEDPITLANIMSVDHSLHVMEIYRGQSRSQLSFGSKRSITKRNFDEPRIAERNRNPDPAINTERARNVQRDDAEQAPVAETTADQSGLSLTLANPHGDPSGSNPVKAEAGQ
ncbi:Flp pilus assembly protein CpaB [Planctomycetes bacterium K23_9]|uniref:SAF domain protein n=1 Tax=Stieleria marina TaxID=1930275 RepID=A0A517NYY6_9BACT|nr:SAF domain protein [Planctomycetes bacterium K23_9]